MPSQFHQPFFFKTSQSSWLLSVALRPELLLHAYTGTSRPRQEAISIPPEVTPRRRLALTSCWQQGGTRFSRSQPALAPLLLKKQNKIKQNTTCCAPPPVGFAIASHQWEPNFMINTNTYSAQELVCFKATEAVFTHLFLRCDLSSTSPTLRPRAGHCHHATSH